MAQGREQGGLPVSKVAWYDLHGRSWLRDILILLHPPYTAWHLSYVAIGAALASQLDWRALGWTVLAFFLAMGIGAHCLDELNGRPLRTHVPGSFLWVAAVVSIAGAMAIGVIVGARETVWVIPSIIFGGFVVFAYNLEWFGGRLHTDTWFGIAWGGFPAITAYVAQTHAVSWEISVVVFACVLFSMAQRALSTQSRFLRRGVARLEDQHQTTRLPAVVLTRDDVVRPAETALKFMTWAVVLLAVGLLVMHLSGGVR